MRAVEGTSVVVLSLMGYLISTVVSKTLQEDNGAEGKSQLKCFVLGTSPPDHLPFLSEPSSLLTCWLMVLLAP